MKKIFLLALIIFILSAAMLPQSAHALGPFGGQIIVLTPCVYPFSGGYVIELGPPSFGSYIYQPGVSFSYSYGPPSHPGQWLLGMSSGGISCATGFSHGSPTDWMGGGLILYHGSSL